MKFTQALEIILIGGAVQRNCWDPEECIYYQSGNLDMTKHTREEVSGIPVNFFDLGDSYTITRMPEIKKCNKDGSVQIWAPTNQDILSMDWISKEQN